MFVVLYNEHKRVGYVSRMGLRMNVAVIIALAMGSTALIGGTTFALFSASSSNNQNVFTAGRLSIDANSESASTQKIFSNLAPGDSGNDSITVTNTGTLGAWVYINDAATRAQESGTLFSGNHPLTLQYSTLPVFIPSQGTHTFQIGYTLPLAAGNAYQKADGTANIVFDAVQSRNNTMSGATGPIFGGPVSFANLDWQASGPNATMISGQPTANSETFSYNVHSFNGSWTYQTTALHSGTISLSWSYQGLHSWFDAYANAEFFVQGPGGTTYTPLVNHQKVYGGFSFNGTTTLTVAKGDTYGVMISGSNFDSSMILQGSFTITPSK